MPSPRWPRRAMTRRSTTLRSDEEFAVSVAAGDRRRKRRDYRAAERGDAHRNVGADRGVDRGIAHDSLLELAAVGDLELRLDERDHVAARFRQSERRRQYVLERDEAR